MSYILAAVFSFLLLYKYWALLAIFFISALVLPIPTSTVLLATGAFASQGYFNFFLSLFAIVASNILGDYVGYLLARRYGRHILDMMHVGTPASLKSIETFLRRHPGPTIFLTRFAGTTDSLANLLAGYSGISHGAFLFYDILGNVVSDGWLLYAGYFLGVHWQDFTGFFNVTDYVLLGVIIVVAISLILWQGRRGRAEAV